ncbi:MAG: hypothetical protein PHG20_12020 [Geobacteraceae bacterium]|nr:hypothetical protein [Geobacteraceae bacterium]
MCGRFTFAISPEHLAEIFGVTILFDFSPRYNIAPTQPVLTIRGPVAGNRLAFMRRGGFPPGQRIQPHDNAVVRNRPSGQQSATGAASFP